MRSPRFWLACIALVAAPAVLGGEARNRFLAGLDDNLVFASDPRASRTWAAWTLRDGAHTDVAVSVRDASGVWSAPAVFGNRDGEDQRNPALAVDARGTLYIAFSERQSGRLMVAALAPGASAWIGPRAIARVENPEIALAAFDAKLGLAFTPAGGSLRWLGLPLLDPIELQVSETNDGPDPVSSNWPETGKPDLRPRPSGTSRPMVGEHDRDAVAPDDPPRVIFQIE